MQSNSARKLDYDDLDKFTPQEMQLILRNKQIFDNDEANQCPLCGRYKSPWVPRVDGPCLYCIEEHLRKNKAISLKHLPERWPAGADTIDMAHRLINEHHFQANKAAVAYIFKAKHTETNGKITLGTCAKQSPKNKMLHGWDYIIEIAWDMWALCDDRQREALMLHEICHIRREDDQWKIAPHTVEEHVDVIEIYGLWKPDLQRFAKAIRDAEDADPNQRQLFESREGD